MTPPPDEKPEQADPWLELDPPKIEPKTVPVEPPPVRIEPVAPSPAVGKEEAPTSESVPQPRPMVPIRYYWRRLVLLGLGFVALVGTVGYFTIQTDPESKYKRGVAALNKRDWPAAIENFDEVIRLRPGDGAAYYNRGHALAAMKQYDRAIADFGEAIRLKTWVAQAHVARASSLSNLGETDRAIADCNIAIRLQPTLSDAYAVRGYCYFKRGENQEALADLDHAVRLNPSDKQNYLDRAYVRYCLRDDAKALADYNRVLALDANNVSAIVGRGTVHQATKQYALAIADFEKAIRLNPRPEEGTGYSHLAWLLATCPDAKFRDGKRALDLATTACESTSWRDRACLQALAAAHAEVGNFAEAVKWEKKGLVFPIQDWEEPGKAEERVRLYEQNKPFREE